MVIRFREKNGYKLEVYCKHIYWIKQEKYAIIEPLVTCTAVDKTILNYFACAVSNIELSRNRLT